MVSIRGKIMSDLNDAIELVNMRLPDSPIKEMKLKNEGIEVGGRLFLHFENGEKIGIAYSQIYGFIFED